MKIMGKKLICALVIVTGLSSCIYSGKIPNKREKTGKMTEKTVSVKPFERIEVGSSFHVYYRQGDSLTINIYAPEKLISRISVRSERGTLYLSDNRTLKDWSWNMSDYDVKIYDTSPDLTKVSIVGSGEFEATHHIDTDVLTLNVAGSGNITLNDVICDKAVAGIAGSGEISINKIVAAESELSISGSGDMDIRFENSGEVQASVVGSGDMELKGKIRCIQSRCMSGSGKINTEELTTGR